MKVTVEHTRCDVCHVTYEPNVKNVFREIDGQDVCYRCAVIVTRANRLGLINAIIAGMPPSDTYAELEVLG